MILLFSESGDYSTNKVVDWLIFWKHKYIRHNGKSDNDIEIDFSKIICSFQIDIDNESTDLIIHRGEKSIISEITSLWYRRPYKGIEDFYRPIVEGKSVFLKNICNKQLKSHYTILKDLIVEFNSKKKVLGSYNITGLNKPIVLMQAKKHGLNIPKTLITNSYNDLISFFKSNNNKIICKALHECIFSFSPEKKYGYIERTNLLEDINMIPLMFAPSLFQEYIEKEFEVRVVYLDTKIYSMCIFSQGNNKTEIDFRNYDSRRPNRMIPYLLDQETERKIQNLMKDIGLNMGSIDLIKARNGKFYFLEINPVGQYDFVSYHCNYNIHREIAKFLTDEK